MRNLFTQLLQQSYSNQTNDTLSRDYRMGVMSGLDAGLMLCATSNRGTTRFLRLAAMVTLLLTLACGNVWGDDRGFWDSGAGSVRFYRNKSSEYWANVNKNGVSDFSLGNIDSDGGLIWTDAWAKVWGGNNIFNSITLYWRVKGQDAGSGPSYSNYNLNWNKNLDGNNQYWEVTMQSQTCSTTGLAAGNYEVEFYWTGAGKDGKTYYLSNNGGNYHANFTLRRKITYHTDGKTSGDAPATEWFSGAATVRDNTGLLQKTGYVFAGWADSKSRADAGTIDHEPGTSSMSVTLTANLDLYPVWKPGSYFISLTGSSTNGVKNTTDFIASQSLTNTATEVNGVTFSKSYYKTANSQSSIKQQYQNPSYFIVYDTKSTTTKIRVYVKNTDSSSRTLYYYLAKEGSTSETDQSVSLSAGEKKVINIDASNSKGTRVILCNNKYDKIFITQIIAIESGTTLPLPGQTGYELAFPGRVASHFPNINGMEIVPNNTLKWNYGEELRLQSGKSVKFTTTAATKMQVKIQSGKGFYVCTDKSNPSTTGFLTSGSSAGTKDIYLDAANTYYIVGETSSNTKIDKISFAAHTACTAPTGLSAGTITYKGATFTVTDGTNANNYEFYVSTSSTAPTASTTPTYTSTSKTLAVDDLTKNTTYYAWVRTNGGYFHKSAWTALTGTTFKTLNAYDITYNCDGAESGCPSATVGLALPNPLPAAPYKPGYVFAGWYTNSGKTDAAVAGASITANTTMYAKWTKVYASGTYTFYGNTTVGSSPSKTVTTSEVSYDAFRVDNLFFSDTKIQFESGTSSVESNDYYGWKVKMSSTIKFFVEEDSDVKICIGTIGGGSCTVSYTDQSSVAHNTSISSGGHDTYEVKAGTMVTLTMAPSSGKSVTLKQIAISASASCSAPAAPTISGTTSYTYGGTISLTATCATGTDASTTYTWYKGSDWATASASSPVQAASTSGATFSKTAAMSDAGTYWCEAANSTCTSHNSSGYAITVAKASISPSLSYTSTTLTTGDNSSSPTVTGNSGSGSVSYAVTSSSPSGCITVNGSTGVVTAVAAGTGTVTATIAATDNYLGGTATADFTVTDPCFYANDLKKSSDFTLAAGGTLDDSKVSGSVTGGAITNSSASSSISGNDKYGLIIDDAAKKVTVTLTSPSIFQAGTVITIGAHVSDKADTGTSKTCGFTVGGNAPTPASKTSETKAEAFTQTYTVVADDGIEGTNHFEIALKSSADKTYIRSIKVTGCGERSGYTVTYNDNGSTSGSVPVDGDSPYDEDATVTVLGNTGSLAKNGYTFAGWNSKADGTGADFTAAGTFTITKDTVLYAKWSPNTYTITYNLNGASWAGGYSAPATYTVGTGATLPVAGNMTNTGYTFDGWYANSDLSTGGVKTEVGTSDYGNKEFWAKWTENTYTITYEANDVSATGSTSDTEGHYVTVADCGFELADHMFAGWNTAVDGSGDSYSAGDEIELTADMTLYAQWGDDYTISWGNVQIGGSGDEVTPNLGGGNYTITASVATWTGTLTTDMISALTDGVTITNVAVDNSSSPKTITATFNVGASVAGESISFELDVPAAGDYGAKSSTKDIAIDRCTGSGGGSDGVLFSAEFKDSGLGTSNICDAANTPYEFTTDELKSAPVGGSISAYTTSNLSHMAYATNAISIAGSNGVIEITLDNAIATNDLFTYLNVNSSSSSAYLRHTSADNTTDQIALTVYNSKEAKVRLTSGFNGKKTLYVVRNSSDFKLHKAAVVRPAFLMLLRDDTPTSTTNLEGSNVEITTSTYLTTIQGGHVYYTSPSSGDLKIYRSSSKNYVNFKSGTGYLKVVLDDALQEGDVIGFDSYNTNNLDFTTTAEHTSVITTTNQLYTVNSSSALKGKTTFYIWQHSGSSDYLRGLQIARSGIAGGGGGSDQITPTLTWESDLSGGVAAETGDADFTHTVTQNKNSLGAITYSSSNTSVATVTSAGKVHIVGAGNATITATLAESGCYEEATASYNITVTDNCEDIAGTIGTEDLGCLGIKMTVTGYTSTGSETFQWYKDGAAIGDATNDNYTATAAGDYYVVVDNSGAAGDHCAMASANTITVEAQTAATATKLVDEWYVKNGRRTPDIALVQTENADNFQVKSGSTVIWDTKESVTTGFAGCSFYLGEDGIIYLKGQKDDETVPGGLSAGDETLKFTAKACGGDADDVEITIHKQAATTRPSVAFVVDGTKEGDFDAENEDHSVGTALYDYLDYTRNGSGALDLFDLTPQNVYSTVDEKAIRQHYSQFDAIIITDDPSTSTKIGKKSCVDAFGTMIDIRPILTMEAYVSSLSNWKAKGISGNPTSPNPRQYAMKLECKDHAIFNGLNPASDNVHVDTEGGVDYWTVTMVDKTKSPYAGLDDDEETGGGEKPALQGFSASNVDGLLLLGEISEGTLYTGVERQDEPAARLMLLGVQYKALPSALTPEGLIVIKNALKYLLKTDMEEVDDCSNYFTDAYGDHKWSTAANWSKGKAPDVTVKARILKPCVIDGTAYAAQVDIATSGKSSKFDTPADCSGKLTIDPTGALIVGGEVHSAKAPYFNTGDLKPTEATDLVLNTNGSNQSALILDNDEGDTKATVNLYSLGRKYDDKYQYQYFAIPMEYLPVNPTFANENHGGTKIYTYVWEEGTSSWTRRKYYDDLFAFEGLGITTNSSESHMDYTMTGNLTSTAERDITLTADGAGNNIIGNSYTAPINIASLVSAFADDESVTKTVYIYCAGRDAEKGIGASGSTETAGQWLAIPIEAAAFELWTGLKVIPAMQAFCIKANTGTTLTLNYKDHVRSTASAQLTEKLRAPKRRSEAEAEGIDLMRIRVADSKTHTDLYLFEGEQFSEAFDNGWEAKYMSGDGRSAKLYAETTIGQLAVAAQPEYEGTVLGFAPGQETEYIFTFSGPDKEYYLNDLRLKKSTLISEGESYLFTFEEGDTNRFYISKTRIDAPAIATGTENTADGAKARKVIVNDKLYIIRNGRVYSAEGIIVK